MCIGSEGNVLAHHRKLALPNDFERGNFAAGDAHTTFDLHGWKIAVLVCYDVEFPEAVRGCAKGGAHLVAVPTALKRQWRFVAHNIVPTRAFENGLFVAYANYCGREGDHEYLGESCFAGPTGKIVAADDQETLLVAHLAAADIAQARREITYLRDCAIFERLSS
jgi:predicted amidohydrolase